VIDLVSRRAYFDDYVDTIEQLPPSLVRYRVRFTCASCGYPTLGESGQDETCLLCRERDSDEQRRIKERIMAAFDEMPVTPMADHERLWAIVLAGMRDLHIT
jgi:hypothetical protein